MADEIPNDDLIRRTYERAAELASRPVDDVYAKRWSQIMQRLGDAAVQDKIDRESP